MAETLTLIGNALPTITPMAVLLIILLSFYRAVSEGNLIPNSVHAQLIESKNREIQTLRDALKQSNAQIDRLIDMGETNIRLIKAITPPVEEDES